MSEPANPADEVVRICQELIRIDSTNLGDGSGPGSGRPPTTSPGSCVRWASSRRSSRASRAVPVSSFAWRAKTATGRHSASTATSTWCPANKDDWQVDPFCGELRDDCMWGRGAVDMKDMDAMVLATMRQLARTGSKPPRDLVFAFFADEEAGGSKGSHWSWTTTPSCSRASRGGQRGRRVQRHHPLGGRGAHPGLPAGDRGGRHRLAPTARQRSRPGTARSPTARTRSSGWRRRSRASAGHGSGRASDIASVRALLDGLSEVTGIAYTDEDADDLLGALEGEARLREGQLQGHRQRDDGVCRLQAQRHPAVGDGRRGLQVPARVTRTS